MIGITDEELPPPIEEMVQELHCPIGVVDEELLPPNGVVAEKLSSPIEVVDKNIHIKEYLQSKLLHKT